MGELGQPVAPCEPGVLDREDGAFADAGVRDADPVRPVALQDGVQDRAAGRQEPRPDRLDAVTKRRIG